MNIRRPHFGRAVMSILLILGLLVLTPVMSAAEEELRVGFLAPMTGIFAQIGKDMTNGFKMYLDEVGGEFDGVKVTLIIEDTQGKPPVNVRKRKNSSGRTR